MKFSRFLAVLAMLLLASVSVFAQSTTTGALTGTVTTDGAPLPGATVTVSSPAAQGSRSVVTDANGNYNIPALPPGDYTVRFELQGLQTVTRTVRVSVTGTSRADADLRVSAVTESITVTASAPAALETQEVQTNFQAETIENLPVARTLLGTVNLAPGVNANGPAGATTISGGFAYDSTYYVDGAVVNEVLRGQPQNLFIEDAIQETTVQTGAISAEFGRFTGGVVTAITKAGGNEFTGSLRDSFNNPAWSAQGKVWSGGATGSLVDVTTPRTDSLVQTYEGTLGGYLLRDRLWFFTAGRYFTFETDRLLNTIGLAGDAPVPYTATEEETRYEVKLTGQITPRHTLVGTYFDIAREQGNNNFNNQAVEFKSLDVSRELPNTFKTINYNGVLTDNLLIEANYARQDFAFVGSGADAPAPPERGTNISFPGGRRAGYPTFCGACSFPEERNNENGKLKASYFLSSGGLGTHNISAGFERYEDMLLSDNHQSASDFSLLVYTNLLNTTPTPGLTRGANGEVLGSVLSGGAYIIYWPILQSSQGNSFRTQSFFVNDKWDLNQNLSFNLGARYDVNKGENSGGLPVADDSSISPRLGVTYDIFGNGRLRANASYSVYSSKIAQGNVGDASSPAGSPSYLLWYYRGPDIINQNTDAILDQVFGWFRSVGYLENRQPGVFCCGGANGIQTQVLGSLETPNMREYTIGIGGQVGANGFLRADYQDREWGNFYTTLTNESTGTVLDPLAGINVDRTLVANSDDFERHYRAVLLQGAYRLFNRFNLGANYTWSTLKGNIEGETAGSGPVTAAGPESYPEILGYERRFPVGYLLQDQRHKARAWVSYDQPTPFGTFNLSLLQRYDSGTPYSAIGTVPVPAAPDYYLSAPSTGTYYFSDRGEFRLDDIHQTDVALNYTLPINRFNLFFQGELLNAFNTQELITPNVTANLLRAATRVEADGTVVADPFNGTYRECERGRTLTQCSEGVPATVGFWQMGANFGRGTNPSTGNALLPGGVLGSYNLPRTFRFSVGLRF